MSKIKSPRWIPEGAEPITREGVNAVCYLYASRSSRPAVLMYGGNRSKSDFHYSYQSEQLAREAAGRYLDGQAERAARVATRKREEQAPTTLTVGAILYSSWGYDQTNVDFYEVTEVRGARAITIRKIAQRTVSSQQGSETVAPVPGEYIGEPMKKISNHRNAVTLDHASAWQWDGTPKSQTAYGWGH